MENTNQLLIIGNGFDLTADNSLKSTFKSFIESNYNNLLSNMNKIKDKKIECENESKDLNETQTYSVEKCLKRILFFKLKRGEEINEEKFLNDLIKNNIIEDEMKNSYKEFISLLNNISSKNTKFNIWTLYLTLYKDILKNWSDVESCINTFFMEKYDQLLNNNPSMFIEDAKIKKILNFLKKTDNISMLEYFNKFINYKRLDDPIEGVTIEEFFYCYFFIIKNNIHSYNLNEINDILKNELYDFEIEFNYYLVKGLNITDYKNNSSKLINKITLEQKFNLLNFNYTNPNSFNIDRSINVHGKLINFNEIESKLESIKNEKYMMLINKYTDKISYNQIKKGEKLIQLNNFISLNERKLLNIEIAKLIPNHPIIGISDTKISRQDKFIYSFTKTFRRMSILNKVNKSSNILLSHYINKVMFFGHSFSDADYPYFKTIFNKFNIFKNNISLIFYYINYGSKKDYDQNIKQIDKIYDLMFKYYKDINNTSSSFSDIIDKMQLEERISVVNIKNIV